MDEVDAITIALQDIGRWDSQLLELVREEKIDPWDIDIALLTRKYLEKINEVARIDFRIPGKAVITAAILLKMKSDRLMEKKYEAQPEQALSAEAQPIREVVIPELTQIKRVVERKITLMELVEALRDAFEVEKRKIQRKRAPGQVIKISPFDMSQFIEGIKAVLSGLFTGRERIALTELPSGEFTLLFLALLHLATEGFIMVQQDGWNTELIVMRPGIPSG